MRHRKGSRQAAWLLALSLVWGAAGAQPPQAWTLQRTLQAALTSHPTIQGRQAAAAAARAELDGAQWQRYPTPSVEAAADGQGGRLTVLRLQQPLWTGGRISAGIEGAARRLDAAEAGVDEARHDIALKVIAAFVEAQRQQARLAAAQRSVAEHERLVAMIERRVEREVSPPVDLGLARARLLQAAQERSATQQAWRNALTQLAQLTGQTVPAVAERTRAPEPPPSLEEALRRASAQAPQLRRLAHELAAAQQDVQLKRAAYYPQVALRAERRLGASAQPTGASSVLLVLEAQPGAGLSAAAAVDAAVARQEAVRLAQETALRELRERVQLDWTDLMAARERLPAVEAVRAAARDVFESYQRQYLAGRKTWIDVLNAAREVAAAELAEADTQAQLLAAALRLSLAVGDLSSEMQP